MSTKGDWSRVKNIKQYCENYDNIFRKKIETKQMGEVWISSDGENSAIGNTEDNAVRNVKECLDSDKN